MNYKAGDRIFFEYYVDNSVGEAIVTKVEPRSYENHLGETVNFNMLHIGKYACIEDYNCLDENDPKVIEYKNTHEDPRIFKDKFEKFLKDNNFDIFQGPIQDYLYNLICN